MRSFRLKAAVAVSAAIIVLSAGLVTAKVGSRHQSGQTRQTSQAAPRADQRVDPRADVREPAPPLSPWEALSLRLSKDPRSKVWGRPVVRVGQNYSLRQDATIRTVTVVFGSATIDGYVDGDVFVWLGGATVSSTAVIRGSLLVVAGNTVIQDGAVIGRDVMDVGGVVSTPPAFSPGGDVVVVGETLLGDRLRLVVPWITRGLLMGRPIVPSLGWVWWFALLFVMLHFIVNAVFHGAVRASAETLNSRPLSAFMTGLLVLLLTGPLSLLLTISIIGVLVVPFAICSVVVAWTIGKVGFARWLGGRVIRQSDRDSKGQSMRSFLIGTAVICLLYIVPVLGLMSFGIIGVFGLGSAVLAFFAALRKENPRPAPIPKRKTPAADAGPIPTRPEPASVSSRFPSSPPMASVSASVSAAAAGAAADTGPADPAASAAFAMHDASGDAAPAQGAARAAAAGAWAGPGPDLAAFPRSAFRERLAAFVLDFLLVWIVYVFVLPFDRHGEVERFFLVLLVYYVGFWTWKQTTVGGIICNLRVTRTDGAPLRFVDAVVRGLSGIFSLAALGLGGLWILRDPERQAWHDKISGTYVVTVPRAWPV